VGCTLIWGGRRLLARYKKPVQNDFVDFMSYFESTHYPCMLIDPESKILRKPEVVMPRDELQRGAVAVNDQRRPATSTCFLPVLVSSSVHHRLGPADHNIKTVCRCLFFVDVGKTRRDQVQLILVVRQRHQRSALRGRAAHNRARTTPVFPLDNRENLQELANLPLATRAPPRLNPMYRRLTPPCPPPTGNKVASKHPKLTT